ncbi:MAG TPA: sugar transferase, partial [Phycisphaeraceae bacterium]
GEDRFLRFKRLYSDADARLARVAVTPDRHLARRWQEASGARAGWRLLRRTIPRSDRTAVSIDGSVYDGADPAEWMPFMRELVQVWRRPDLTVPRACQRGGSLWCDQSVLPDGPTRFIGPVWIGAGRQLAGVDSVVGPAVLWDDPAARPPAPELPWRRLEPVGVLHEELQPRHLNRVQRASKRLFDIVFSLIVLALTLPLYPLIMLAIWLDDGPPFFFIHRRETMGGRQFPCLKFRSMRRNAERLKEQVAHQNLADGPQFYIERDPRLTRVGRWLRALNLDELPQFINVLLGHMSVVGPRPSPYEENQYCPPWREARLSVRPGITGLWQIKRSRAQGLDFQEWIRYDIEYVENMSWKLDLWIIWQTLLHLLHLRRG